MTDDHDDTLEPQPEDAEPQDASTAEEPDAAPAAGDEEPTGDAPEPEESQPAEREAAVDEELPAQVIEPGAALIHDGLESGLAWFGELAFEPPLAPGMGPGGAVAAAVLEAPPAVAEAPPRLSAADRQAQMRERLAARRKETQAQRKWYQKIPIPILFCIPAVIFIIVYVLVVRPWDRMPEPTEKFDQALIDAAPLADQHQKLGAAEATLRGGWKLVEGDILVTKAEPIKYPASVFFAAPPQTTECVATCEVCLIGKGHYVSLELGEATFLRIEAKGRGYQFRMRAHEAGNFTLLKHPIKLRHWYTLQIRIEGGETAFLVNGYELRRESDRPPQVEDPPQVEGMRLKASGAALAALRNWSIEPIE